MAANSTVDYGTSANYGSSTPVSSAMVTSHQVALSGLTTGTLYHFRVRSTDAKGHNAASGDMTFATASATVPSITSLNPTTGFVGTSVAIAGANFGATQGTSTITFNGVAATATSWSATSITATVPSGATTGNVVVTIGGVASNGASFTVQANTTPPTVPTGLTATAVSSSQINLSWTASTDNVGVTGYNVYRGGVKIGVAPSTTFQDGGLTASTSYSYNVSAFDAAGNTSAQSAGASATTQAASSGGGIPSTLGWYQIPNSLLRPLCPSYPDIQAVEGCPAVMADWSGGLFDTKRNRFIITGGGHNGYYGNEIYAVDLNANPIAPILVKDATHGAGLTAPATCSEANADGSMNSRHNYNGLVYLANQDLYMVFGGSKSACGFFSGSVWYFDPSTLVWTRVPTAGSAPNPSANGSPPELAYDPTTGNVFQAEANTAIFWKFDPVAKVWSNLANVRACGPLNETNAIDNGRRLYFCIGNGSFYKISLNPPYQGTALSGSGCGNLASISAPGFVYDPVQKLMVGWAGGNTAYLYNPDTDSCTMATYSGGPTIIQKNGTYGRFQYSPATGVFIVANSVDTAVYTLRLTSPSGTGSSGPSISGISVGTITTSSAIVTWTTDVSATSQVEYGTTTSYGTLTTLNSNLVTSHSISLSGLATNTLYHYRVRSKNSSGVESLSGDAVFQTSSVVDTIPPTISITAPANGATVSATVTVSANATDNVGVTKVQFFLDGANLGAALSAAPYSVNWDTTSASNASHTLTAQAWDAAGNVGNAVAASVTVSNSTSTALQDFQTRCATTGVIVCEGFDSASEFVAANYPNTGLAPGGDGTIQIVQDTSIYASGGGALHFPIKANDGTGPTVRDDNWLQTFCSAHPPAACTPTVFGQNSTFYVQFRYRVDASYASTNWELLQNGGSTPKIADFANTQSSCGNIEITTSNHSSLDMPSIYTACGAAAMYVNPGTTNWNNSTPPFQWENGYYNCSYPQTPGAPGGCFAMPANTWMTFYYKVHIGTWGQPDSIVKAWVAPSGQALNVFVDVENMTLNQDSGLTGYNAIWFNVYMTGFSSAATNPAANTWLDEVIVSTAPIPAPGANGGGIPQ